MTVIRLDAQIAAAAFLRNKLHHGLCETVFRIEKHCVNVFNVDQQMLTRGFG